MATSVSGEDEPNHALGFVTDRTAWRYIARSGLPAVSGKKNSPEAI